MALTKIKRGGLDTGITDNSDANALTFDSSENATFVGSTTIDGVAKISEAGSGNVLLETTQSSKYLQLKSNEGIYFSTSGANHNYIDSSNNLHTQDIHSKDIYLDQPRSNWRTIQYRDTDNSNAIQAYVSAYNTSTSDGFLRLNAIESLQFRTGDTERLKLTSSSATFSGDVNLTTANSKLGIGKTASSGWELDIETSSGNANARLKATATNQGARLEMDSHSGDESNINFASGGTAKAQIVSNVGNSNLLFKTNGTTTALTLDSSQNATFAGTINSGAITSSAGIIGTTGTFSGNVHLTPANSSGNATTVLNIGVGNDTNSNSSGTKHISQLQMEATFPLGDNGNPYTMGQIEVGNTAQDWNTAYMQFEVGASSEALVLYGNKNASFGGRVGIDSGGYTQQQLHVGDLGTLLLSHNSDTVGEYAGIHMRAEGDEENGMLRTKGLIAFERTGAYGVGDMKFCINGDGNNTAVTNSDVALKIDSSKNATFDQRVYITDGSAAYPAYSFTNDTNTGMYRAADDNIGFGINGVSKMTVGSTIDMYNPVAMNNQRLGLGKGAVGTPSLSFQTDGDDVADYDTGMWSPGSNQIAFSTGGTKALSIYNDQNIAVNGHFYPEANNTESLGFASYRWATVYGVNENFSSDQTLKKNISTSDLGMDFIKSLNPVKFNWKKSFGDDTKQKYGFLAQEIKETGLSDSVTGEEGEMGMSYNDFIAPIVKALQELSSKVEALENK